jgi:phage terminase large subunit
MRLRIACFRELQNSIDESSYSTIKNIIIDTWKDGSWIFEWDIQKTTIISKRTGSEFIFSGLRYKIDSVKSMARIDIAWVDEARNCSKTTLDKLAPTIRGMMTKDENGKRKTTGGPFGKGPEIWYTYNPELDTDEIYKRTVKQKEKYFPDYVMNKETGEMERYAIHCKS